MITTDTELRADVIDDIPEWATCGLMYDDWSGCTEEDKKMATNFVARLAAEGWELIQPIDGTHDEFTPHPAFGLACATCTWEVRETFRHTY